MDTRKNIKVFGRRGADHWYYDGWNGFSGQWIDDWYTAECTGPGERSISGPHRPTSAEAEKDARQLMTGDEHHAPYESARVVKHSPALRISVEREVT